MKRKQFLKLSILAASGTALTGGSLVGCGSHPMAVKGSIIGANSSTGHLLRDGAIPEPSNSINKKVVIIGGGVSGLSAARELSRQGITDFLILELDDAPGGNALHGSNEVSAFPWGAHYVPLPNNDLREYLEFLLAAGCITGYDDKGLPVYNEEHLCFDPEERLYINGHWQEGLVPNYGLSAPEQEEIKKFMQLMNHYRFLKGLDGLYAFAIPVISSSGDAEFRKLDGLTMKGWMESIGFVGKSLHSYVNYCCRDDFGTPHSIVSAWAGVHYFASRKGVAANATYADVLTWPEGNGFLIRKLLEGLASDKKGSNEDEIVERLLINALSFCVRAGDHITVDYYDTKLQKSTRISAEYCVMAVPQFVAARLLNDDNRSAIVTDKMHYVPWMVANLKVKQLQQRSGAASSWDNVIHDRYSLGYVDATHQLLQQQTPVRNLTYYHPLTAGEPSLERRKAYEMKHEDWVKMIFDELAVIHPDIREMTEEINIMLWGHSMVQPIPGLIWGTDALPTLRNHIDPRIKLAHTDLSGISIFEEGFYQGLAAAKSIIGQEVAANTVKNK